MIDEKMIRLLFHHVGERSLANSAARKLVGQIDAFVADEDADEKRSKALHPSALAVCLRQAAFELNGMPRSSVNKPEHVRRAAKIGTALHKLYQHAFKKAAELSGVFEFDYEVPLNQYGHPDVPRLCLDGSSDGVFSFNNERLTLEIKGVSADVFNALQDPLESHVLQASTYQHCHGSKATWFIYISRATFAETHRVVRIPETYWHSIRRRAQAVLDYELRDQYPPGINDMHTCSMCTYKPICLDPVGEPITKMEVLACLNEGLPITEV